MLASDIPDFSIFRVCRESFLLAMTYTLKFIFTSSGCACNFLDIEISQDSNT
jgi:hypothetical protein